MSMNVLTDLIVHFSFVEPTAECKQRTGLKSENWQVGRQGQSPPQILFSLAALCLPNLCVAALVRSVEGRIPRHNRRCRSQDSRGK